METCHGGDIYALERPVLDFSVNLNPLGMPECAVRAAAESIAACDRYPDPQCRRLRQAISRYERVPEDYILCGNGASDLIFRLAAACGARRIYPVREYLKKALEYARSNVSPAAVCGYLSWALR